ncbi:TfoX/Sxy family protein [Corallococcus sp. M34]|uniref:TfoX/Sxy family protein n=1 Tax=Citreicoccus inhibens TaxID=2849499 RepID=UPI001C2241A7|nr:TfoX/Sxy family protein [Citreicoccus inhibens]MBU8900194.1 TfoX/Sxy family protein [Citreicoccus inhibens]
MVATYPHLTELLEEASQRLPAVSRRRMFGCDALFANDTIYALVWKTGRIGLRFPEATAFEELMGRPGSDPWMAGPKTMSHWVLVPESFHDETEELTRWVRRAHALALANAGAPKTPARKKTAKKEARPAAKKATTRGRVSGGARRAPSPGKA